jgi:excisionase family DNA binding protein
MSRYSSPHPNPAGRSTSSSGGKTTPPRRWKSSKQAAEYLGISPNGIRKLVADGKLPAYLIGEKKLVKFDTEDLDNYLAKCRVDNK